jgi:serine/threonine protein kinase
MPVAALSRTTMTRFNNECRILSSLSHRNIARFHESGNTDDGVPFVVMEYVDGVPVDRYCETRQLDVVGRISVFLSICAAVQYAHERRIIHRDLKPGNILVPSNGAPKLLDFGIAKLVRPEQKLTAATTVTSIMTPSYASPEQLRGEKIGTPSDIYSLGLVLYRILTGGLPFGDSERSPADLERLIAEQEPLPPSIRASDESLRGDVDAIILTTLRRNPTERYSSAGVLADDLHRYLTGKPTSVSARG